MTILTQADLAELEERAERARKFKELLAFVRQSTPEELSAILAKNRVKRGFRWLARNAPSPGWWRNCFNPDGRCRINMRYSEESVLTLAFEYETSCADKSGYVKDWKVLRRYFGPLWSAYGKRYGFDAGFLRGYKPFLNRFPDVVIDADLLTRCWEARLRNPPGDWTIQYRHRTPIDLAFLSDDPVGPPRGRLRRLLSGIPDALCGRRAA